MNLGKVLPASPLILTPCFSWVTWKAEWPATVLTVFTRALRRWKTVKTVGPAAAIPNTPLKRGVNEIFAGHRVKGRSPLDWALLCFSAFLALTPRPLRACAACFGQSDSSLAQGMNMGILSLLVVVLFVLGGIAAFFIYLMKRASAAAAAAAAPKPLSPVSK